MAKLSSKIVSTLIGVAVGVSAVSVAAAVHPASTSNAVSSETSSVTSSVASEVTSSAVSPIAEVSSAQAAAPSNPTVSSKEVSNVEDSIKEIQQATDNGVSKIHAETDKAVSQIQEQLNEDGKKSLASVVYPIIDPETGREPVYSSDKDYARCKAELAKFGDDAGKVPIDKSKACQAALAALKEKSTTTQAPTK